MKIERYGSEKIMHMLCGANFLVTSSILFLKLLTTSLMVNICTKYYKKFYKSLEAAFIALFSETTMTLTIGKCGKRHPQRYESKMQEVLKI